MRYYKIFRDLIFWGSIVFVFWFYFKQTALNSLSARAILSTAELLNELLNTTSF